MTRGNAVGVKLGRFVSGMTLCVACWLSMPEPVAAAGSAAPFVHQLINVGNGCFVESVALGDDLRARAGEGVWYRVLQWGAKDGDEVVTGHAVLVFEHKARLWSYDINHGFTALDVPLAQRDDLEAVAKRVTAPYAGKITPRYPIYREDFPQTPEAKPPTGFDGVAEPALRDAERVALRLAKARPVALLEFMYPRGGDTKRGAAVAFIYNGRLCVYTPTHGTVPFRVQALSLKNVRQLQELLRRIYPGASGLKVR